MINSSKRTKLVNKVHRHKKALIDKETNFIIIPFYVSGFMDFANTGILDRVEDPQRYETFKRVWTGNDACIISWKGSYYVNQDNQKNLIANYKIGDYFTGKLVDNNSNNNVSTDKSFTEYTTQESNINITVQVDPDEQVITPVDEFLFYKFPELYGNVLFRLVDVEKNYDNLELISQSVRFESVNQSFANTGRAKLQNIMPNAPGQGYLEPQIVGEEWRITIGEEEFNSLKEDEDYKIVGKRYIIANKEKMKNNPVKRVEIKQFGASTHTSLVMWGRKARYGDDFRNYGIPRLIFPMDLRECRVPTIYRSTNASSNYKGGRFAPTIQYSKDFMTATKALLDVVNQWDYQGLLYYDKDEVNKSNPDQNKFAGDDPFTGGGKEQAYKYSLSGGFDIENPTFKEPWQFNMKRLDVDTTFVLGCKPIYKTGGVKKVHDHMFDAYWSQKKYETLPINSKSTLGMGSAFSLATMAGLSFQSIVPSMAILLIGGVAAMFQATRNTTFERFFTLMPAELLDFNQALGYSVSTSAFGDAMIPFNVMQSDSQDNPASMFINSEMFATGYNALLTDQIMDDDLGQEVRETTIIGQEKDENGNYILMSRKPFLLAGNTRLVNTKDAEDGYIIDNFLLTGVINGDFQIDFIDTADKVVWSAVYQSEGKWSKSTRQIHTFRNTSILGRENLYATGPIPWPVAIVPTLPPKPTDQTLINKAEIGADLRLMADRDHHFDSFGRLINSTVTDPNGESVSHFTKVGFNEEFVYDIDSGTPQDIRARKEFIEFTCSMTNPNFKERIWGEGGAWGGNRFLVGRSPINALTTPFAYNRDTAVFTFRISISQLLRGESAMMKVDCYKSLAGFFGYMTSSAISKTNGVMLAGTMYGEIQAFGRYNQATGKLQLIQRFVPNDMTWNSTYVRYNSDVNFWEENCVCETNKFAVVEEFLNPASSGYTAAYNRALKFPPKLPFSRGKVWIHRGWNPDYSPSQKLTWRMHFSDVFVKIKQN